MIPSHLGIVLSKRFLILTTSIKKSRVADSTLSWFQELVYALLYGPEITFEGLFAER
jgi:hypothetical protein